MVSKQFQREIICQLGFQIINHHPFLCRLKCSIFTWSAPKTAGQLQSYQATPANFKANHLHRRKSRTSSAVLDMAATDLPPIEGQVGVLVQTETGKHLAKPVLFENQCLKLPNKGTYFKNATDVLRMDWIYGTKGSKEMAFLDVLVLI